MLTVYFVNAFVSGKILSGNPAAVCILEEWLEDSVMQSVASQHNLSETAFLVKMAPSSYAIRWFTPVCEVDLCGHATLAAGHVLFEHGDTASTEISFQSASGELTVSRKHTLLTLDFPLRKLVEQNIEQYYLSNGPQFIEAYSDGSSAMLVCRSEFDVANFKATSDELCKLEEKVIYVTSASESVDFVCRVFAPKLGIAEDPVTGSAYTSLAPYWADRLQQTVLRAKQLSERGGDVLLEIIDQRLLISGDARTVMVGQWLVEPKDKI